MHALKENINPQSSRIVKIPLRKENQPVKENLLISTQQGLEIIQISDIVHCHAEGSYCQLILKDQQIFIVSKNLKMVSEALKGHEFIRVHQSHLVSFTAIKKVQPDGLVLKNGTSVPIARRKRQELIKLLQQKYHLL